jgi:uncharacterized membrane protein
MLLDRRDRHTISAAITSFNALRHNLRPMLCFAAVIVGLTAAGFATRRLGLILALPLIGICPADVHPAARCTPLQCPCPP